MNSSGIDVAVETRPPALDDYLAKPYHLVLVESSDEDGHRGWVAEIEELPGCISQGVTPDVAIQNVRDAMAGWVSVALEDGLPIPEPSEDPTFSGKFMTRVPPSLHAALSRRAGREGVSLNQYVTAALANAIGVPAPMRSYYDLPVGELLALTRQYDVDMRPRMGGLLIESVPGVTPDALLGVLYARSREIRDYFEERGWDSYPPL